MHLLKAKSKTVPQSRQRKQVPIFSNLQDFRMDQTNKNQEQNDVVYDPEEFKDVQPKVNHSKRNKSKPKDWQGEL